jgi:hypothetical protein
MSRALEYPTFHSHTDPDKIQTLSFPIGRMLTYEEALDRKSEIRYVISSQHDTQKFLSEFAKTCPNAVYMRQAGNPSEHVWYTKHLLSSDIATYEKARDEGLHAILYHQEFPRCYVPKFGPDWTNPIIRQYINWAHNDTKNREFYLYFKYLAQDVGYEVFENGKGGEDGEVDYHSEMVELFANSTFTLHHKAWDGYGMIAHQSYACGRPVICFESDYRGKMAEKLMQDMKTAVFISGDAEYTKKKLEAAIGHATAMQVAARRRFQEVVNFDEEEKEIRKWLAEM